MARCYSAMQSDHIRSLARHAGTSMTLSRHVALAAVLVTQSLVLLAGAPSQTTAPLREALPGLEVIHDGAVGGWSAVRIRSGPTAVDAYLVHDQRPKPVVILMQGSGCIPAFTIDADGTYRSTSLFQDAVSPAEARVHFAMVEKRGVSPVQFRPGMTQAQKVAAFERARTECSSTFFENATKEGRVADVLLLMQTLAPQPWVTGFMLVGHSEGTHVATGILKAYRSASITAAGLFASAGPTPFWGGRYSSSDSSARQDFDRNLGRLRQLQQADDNAMYDGLPARRWKTFWIQSTPLDDIRDSDVPLFVAQGSRDGTLLPADLFVMEAVRQNATRPVRYVVVAGGDHAFETAPGRSRVIDLFDDFLRWAFDSKRTTGTTVLQ